MIEDINRYAEIKNIVMDIYLRHKIEALPVSVMSICRAMNIVTIPYREAWQDIVDLGLERECIERRAFALKFIENNRWFIFYNCQTIPRMTIKYFLAYELGHILLDHEMAINVKTKQAMFSMQSPEQLYPDVFVTESRLFAVLLLAPLNVLQALSIYKSPDIEYLCGIAVDTNYEDIYQAEGLCYTNSVICKEREQQVMDQFSRFIDNYPLTKY